MSTITTLNDGITGASFRGQVNTNFSNLNTDKAETSALTAGLATKQDVLTGLTASVTELNYTDGVTSAIQTQLDGKQATITGLTASGAELNILDGATLTTTELNYVDGVTSAIQTQIDGKQATLVSGTNIKTINSTSLLGSGDIAISGAVSDGDKGDITVSGTGATWTIDNNVVSNAKLATVATATFKGRTTAGTGNVEDLTATEATALLNVAVGDSGSGGTKGLVPAPTTGDATKFLRGDMTYVTISGGGDALTSNPLSQFASTTSAQLAGVMSDETGTGSLVFGTSPTLTTPRFADNGFIADSNGNEMVSFNLNASAVNYLEIENGSTTNPPHLRSKGDDTNIGLHLVGKGTGEVSVCDATDETKRIRFGVSNNSTGAVTSLRSNSTTSRTIDLPDATDTLVGKATTDTLTNKSISLGSNTLTTTKAQLDTALTDGNIVYTDAIGVSVQAYDADLTTWAGITPGTGVGTALAVAVGSAGAIVTNGGALGTPSSGTLTNATGLPVSGITSSTSTALGVGSLEVGHATDSTITRVSAGVLAIESNNIITANITGSTTQAGIAEASIASEVNTGTDANRYVSPDSLAGSNFGIRYVAVSLNGTTALTTSDKAYFRIPAAFTGMNLVSVGATVGTGASGSSSSGVPTFTVKNVTDNAQMLSTNLTVDAGEYTSATAATPAVINTSTDDVVTDDLIEVACTVAGTGVTYATISLGFQLP